MPAMMNTSMNARTYRYTDMMLEHASVGIAVYDARDLRLLEANTLFMTILNTFLDSHWQCERVIGHPLTSWATHIDFYALSVVEIFCTVAETGVPYRGAELVVTTGKRGTTYWNWSVSPVRDEDGRVTHLVQTLNDVTEQVLARRKAEQAQNALSRTHSAVEAERRRLEVVETVARSVREYLDTEHIGNIALDAIAEHFQADGSCLHIADHAQQVLRLVCARQQEGGDPEGWKSMEYIPFERTIAGKQTCRQREPIVLEDLQVAAEMGLFNKKNPLVAVGVRGYVCVPLWFGDRFEGTLCANFTRPICPDGPEVKALVGSGTHLAAALAHARLHSSTAREQTRLLSILDQLPEGILIADISNSTITYANLAAANILGLSLDELLSTPLHRHPWSHAYTGQSIDGKPILPWNFAVIRALGGETIKSKETLVIKPCGTKIVTLTSSAPLYANNGAMTGAMIVFQDVTAQKSLEQHKNDFLSIANHELRTPITIIQGFAEILQLKATQDQPLDSLTQYALTSITEQSQHLTHLIEEMLDISRIEQAQLVLRRTPCDLLSILARVIDSQSITTRQHQLHLVLDGLQTTDTLIAYADEERMVQVFNNLISNAIKYSPAGGEIEIGLRHMPERATEVLIWVKDHGIGIAANEIPNIFKRFHRASNLDRSLSGFGIGLYLVKEVVIRHGGRVWVESQEGQGSTFYVILPLNV